MPLILPPGQTPSKAHQSLGLPRYNEFLSAHLPRMKPITSHLITPQRVHFSLRRRPPSSRCQDLPPEQIPQPLEFIRTIRRRTLPINSAESISLSHMRKLRQLAYFTPHGLQLRHCFTFAASPKLIKEKIRTLKHTFFALTSFGINKTVSKSSSNFVDFSRFLSIFVRKTAPFYPQIDP